jgi:GNAT superfamily N-acetyltransferase
MDVSPLAATDDRASFCCGDPDLDRFFHRYAGQNQFKHHLGVTYVGVEGADIRGFATVTAGNLQIDALPVAMRRKLPAYPLPILRLARLAVASAEQRRGIGRQLLLAMFEIATRMDQMTGCVGLVVDAKPTAIGWYEQFGFLALEAVEGLSTARPLQTPMFLSLAEIEAARR